MVARPREMSRFFIARGGMPVSRGESYYRDPEAESQGFGRNRQAPHLLTSTRTRRRIRKPALTVHRRWMSARAYGAPRTFRVPVSRRLGMTLGPIPLGLDQELRREITA